MGGAVGRGEQHGWYFGECKVALAILVMRILRGVLRGEVVQLNDTMILYSTCL